MTKETAMGDHHHHGHGPHEHGPVDWKHNGIKVIPGDQLDPNTAQTPGMNRAAAINLARAGPQKLWAGTVKTPPKAKPGAHHPPEPERVIYVVSGRAPLRRGDNPARSEE